MGLVEGIRGREESSSGTCWVAAVKVKARWKPMRQHATVMTQARAKHPPLLALESAAG
jgi:hypothetical protein